MADLTKGYNVPGVYVRDATGPLVTSASVPDAVVTLVGPAVGFQTATDAVLASETPQALSHRGLWLSATDAPAGVFAPVVKNAAGTVLVEDTDFVFSAVFDDNGVNNPANRISLLAIGDIVHLATPVISSTSTATTGGSLVAGTYGYRVSAIDAFGETLASTESTQVVPSGTATNTVTLNWGAVTGATGYKIYGRTAAGELHLATVSAVTTYVDTGAVTPSGALPSANTTGSTTANGVAVGDILVISYCYTNATYYTPLLFDDYDLVVQTYGEPLRKTLSVVPGESAVTSPLTLAAAIAFQNGATRIICVATDPTPVSDVVPSFDAQLRAAYAKTLGDYRVGVLVPILADGGDGALATLTSYGTDLKNHVEGSSADGYQRIGILGPPANAVGITANVPPPFEEVAQAVNSARVIMAYPNRLSYYNPATNRPVEVDGFYLAAAYAGILEANPVQQSLTREQVVGFSGLPASITRLNTKPFKDNLSSKGVAVAEIDRQNRLIIRHGLSTDVSNVITREVSITRARDTLFEALQIGLDNSGLIGAPIDYEMTTRIKGAVSGILESMVQDQVIIAYTNLQVRQQTLAGGGDPTVIEVRFAYQPALPLNYIIVTFSLDLTTGDFNVGDAASSVPA